MIFYGSKNGKGDEKSCLSKIKAFTKEHPFIFYGIIVGIIVLIVIVVVLCIVLTRKKENIEEQENEEIKIFPLKESSKSEVIDIYNKIGNNDKGTLAQFGKYLSEKTNNLKEEQKVYLAYYWITKNIKYDYAGRRAGTVEFDPSKVFQKRTTVCSGYSILFKELLLLMNYTESKIKNIVGYSKGEGYSSFEEPKEDHEWNAVEINGQWCLIDTTWDATLKTEYYLCTPPRCFVRDHLPSYDNSLQFLKNPISLETFHQRVETKEGYCKYNVDIIEDKAIQTFCGKGKVIIKYSIEKENARTFLDFSPVVNAFSTIPIFPSYFVTRIKDGFNIDISVNEKSRSQLAILLNNSFVGAINFNCDKEPNEKFYYPIVFEPYRRSDAELISPIQGNLIRGQSYNFEIRTNEFEELYLYKTNGNIKMVKQGNIFKVENVVVEGKSITISKNIYDCLVSFDIVDE